MCIYMQGAGRLTPAGHGSLWGLPRWSSIPKPNQVSSLLSRLQNVLPTDHAFRIDLPRTAAFHQYVPFD